MNNLTRYKEVLRIIRLERGDVCECCGDEAKHGHHINPVSETSIASELVFYPPNIMMLCDDCHCLMHPLLRNVNNWAEPRKKRGQALNG